MGIHRNFGFDTQKNIEYMESNLEAVLSGKDVPEKFKEAAVNNAKNDPKVLNAVSKVKELKLQYQREYFCLTGYESIEVKGGVLVDGNYLYLESLRTLKDFILDGDIINPQFNKYFEAENIFLHDEQKLLLKSISEDEDALASSIVKIASFLFTLNTGNIYKSIIQKLFQTKRNIYEREELVSILCNKEIKKPMISETIYYDYELDVNFFDAKLPELDKAYRILQSESKKAKNGYKSDDYLKQLKSGIWQSYHEGETTSVPYNLKNKYINQISKSLSGDLIEGRKILKRNFLGGFFGQEKEVDTRLTIKGVELANQNDLDFVLLVTNDSDYIPLIEYMHEKNKKVFLYSPGKPKQIANSLVNVIGSDNCLNRNNYFHNSKLSVLKKDDDSDFKLMAFLSVFMGHPLVSKRLESFASKEFAKQGLSLDDVKILLNDF